MTEKPRFNNGDQPPVKPETIHVSDPNAPKPISEDHLNRLSRYAPRNRQPLDPLAVAFYLPKITPIEPEPSMSDFNRNRVEQKALISRGLGTRRRTGLPTTSSEDFLMRQEEIKLAKEQEEKEADDKR